MSKEYYLSVRAAPPLVDDEYTEDMQPLPYRQPPRLTRTQAEAAWREERETAFFSILMVQSTSYRSDWLDDLMNSDSGRRRFKAWREQIEADRLHREQALERIQREIAKHKTETACQHDRQRGEHRNHDDRNRQRRTDHSLSEQD